MFGFIGYGNLKIEHHGQINVQEKEIKNGQKNIKWVKDGYLNNI
jgi:hypothetical protein